MLNVCKELLDQFEKQNILYCHWKGNDHVYKGLNGIGDIDILVSIQMKEKCSVLLRSINFVHVITQKEQRSENIEDWIGLDLPSGKLVHLHLHYELKIGHKYVNEYNLPFNDLSLKLREYDSVHNIYVQNPCIELLILYSRIVLEKSKDERSKNKYQASFSFLINRISYGDFVSILKEAGIEKGAQEEFLNVLSHKSLERINFEKVEREVKKIIIKNTNFAQLKYYIWKYRITIRKIQMRYNNNSTTITKKLLPARGFIWILDDNDTVNQVKEWLNWKIEVKIIDIKLGNRNPKRLINDLEKYLNLGGIALIDNSPDCDLMITNLKENIPDIFQEKENPSNLLIVKTVIWKTINSREKVQLDSKIAIR
ncbi:hypothetical protein [Salipaludibacillus daqingensis]|uniref:hypothetical protein n=1 Tax=Salipaludibacillus daqingensis TaxID=3041001 RepID=UPI002477271D|nr:hypothetical protein [Salipaludibacillus daqingensis]